MNLAKKICSLCLTLVAMLNSAYATNYIVSTKTDLQAKYTAALPSDTVIVANGTYDWGQLVLSNSNGTITSNWIVIKAQTLNGVVFTGSTYIQFGGKRIMITGFKFANGNAGFNDVIQFRSSTSISSYAQYCRLNNITIENYSSDSTGATAGLSTASDNKWVSLYGIRNRIDHCTFIDKYNGGATVVVWYDNSNYPQQSTSTYHLIDSNYFNKRSFVSGNGGESIRVGVGLTSSTYGYNVVEYNLFENMTQEEPEIISNKSGFNTYRYNTFKNCSGGLTLRRGRYCSVYGNFFIVNKSTLTDDYGIRIIDKGHKVYNNYIEGVNGNKNSLTSMRCPIILYNGTNSVNDTTNPSLVSGYMPGDSCIIAFNTIVNCEGGAGISLGFTDNGSNTFQPLGITIANNLVKMTSGQAAYNPTTNTSLTYTAVGNIYSAPSGRGLTSSTGFSSATLSFGSRINGILTPPSLVQDAAINTSSYSSMLNGLDVNGLTRSSIYDVGCDEINSAGSVIASPLDSTQVGAGMPLIASIKSFTPSIAYNGTTITIKGTNFVNVSNVNFGGINATSYTVQNDSTITAVVSSGTSGNVNVTANGFVSTITGFIFCSPLTSTNNVSICPSALPYSWNGSRTVAGTYTFTATNSQGCDSTAKLNLTIKTNTTSTTNVSICQSALPYSWNGSRTVAGTYTFKTTNSQGCDSTATLNLTIKTNTTSTTNVSICPSALPYSWNGSRTLAGTYTFTTTNSQGCDSTATLNLTIKTNTTSTTNVSICPSALPYSWNGSRTVAGTYTFKITNSQGCDSTATLNLTIKTNTTSITNLSICQSALPYSWNGSRTVAGTYTFKTTNSQGCDSTATLNLTIKTNTTSTTNVSICQSALPYSWNGSRTVAGTYTFTTTNSQGCDSTATLNFTVKTTSSSISDVNVCANQLPYIWNSISYNLAGTYTSTGLLNSRGCDSFATLHLTVGSPVTPAVIISTSNATVCSNDAVSFTANGSNGGISPVYQWQKNGSNVGAGSSIAFLPNTLNNGDVISCILTANNLCQTSATATSNAITMTVRQSPSVAPITNGISTITSASLCTLGNTYKYYDATPYGTWSSSNTSVASVTGGSQAGVVTVNTNGTAIISYYIAATNGCVSTSSVVVTVAAITPNAITGNNSICVNATTSLSCTAPVGTTGVWSSSNDRGTINTSGVYTGTNAGTYGEAKYTVTNASGCSAFASKTIVVNPTPVVPTITYAPGTPNPQLGAPTGGFCVGKKFRVVATPNVPAGVWSATGFASFTGYDTVNVNAVGAGSIKYTYTSAAGCVNSRTMTGTGYSCAARGVILNNQLETTNDFFVYPNPSRNYLNVQIEKLIPNSYLSINDIYGKLVQKIEIKNLITNISTEKFSNGIYIIQVIENNIKSCHHLITVSK